MASSNQRKKTQIQGVLMESKPLTAQKIAQKTHIDQRKVLKFLTSEEGEVFVKKSSGGNDLWAINQQR